MHETESAQIKRLLKAFDDGLAVYGVGNDGRFIATFLEQASVGVTFFVDAIATPDNSQFNGKPLISPAELAVMAEKPFIAVASSSYYDDISSFLREAGLLENVNYISVKSRPFNVAVCEYGVRRYLSDAENRRPPLFEYVEIETINRCNNDCGFCPVNRNNDQRHFERMDDAMFDKILSELAALNYAGRIALFSNNEPLLDKDLIRRNSKMRATLPGAFIYLYTNGILLTLERFREMIVDLDMLVIDSYSDDLKLPNNILEVRDYCENHPELQAKVRIYPRLKNEVLTTRGGQAPNKLYYEAPDFLTCVLPFKQMIIRPNGKISLCCNDALGVYTLGNLNEESLSDIWYGQKYQGIREAILQGRSLTLCRSCDNIFFYNMYDSHDI